MRYRVDVVTLERQRVYVEGRSMHEARWAAIRKMGNLHATPFMILGVERVRRKSQGSTKPTP